MTEPITIILSILAIVISLMAIVRPDHDIIDETWKDQAQFRIEQLEREVRVLRGGADVTLPYRTDRSSPWRWAR